MKIPFVDLHAQYQSIKTDIDNAIQRVIKNSSYIGGEEVVSFEKAFANHMGMEHCVGCANGTDSIEILLECMGIGTGDEVIVPAISWISTSEAVGRIGASPVFVDICPKSYTIDVNKIEAAISNKTKVIIPVHLYGQAADMESIMAIANKHKLIVIEDCAQAHDAEFKGKKVGTWGHAGSFSFYPGKNLGAYGDAGGIVTNDKKIADKFRQIANHGQVGKHNHVSEGRNSRLDGLQAAILNAKLPYLKTWTEKRISIAAHYNQLLKDNNSIKTPVVSEHVKHVFHLYVIQTNNREELVSKLNKSNIQTAIHYPMALPFLNCYSSRGFTESDFPVASAIQSKILSLPMFAELTDEDVKNICEAINS